MRRAFLPALFGLLLCLAIGGAIGQSLYRIPIQVSDSLDALLVSARASSATRAFIETLRYSNTTLRPMRYVQGRWLLRLAEGTGLTYRAVFRGVHVALMLSLLLMLWRVLPIGSWIELAALGLPLLVLVGHHTFVALLREAYPVNHYLEVAAATLAVVVLARGKPHWVAQALIPVMLAFCLLVIESGVMIWVAIVCCVVVGLPGIRRVTAIVCTLVLLGYFLDRYQLGIGAVGIGGYGSGFGDQFLEADELKARFGEHPLGFLAYNVAGSFLSILFSEPRYGVYQLLRARNSGDLPPGVLINIVSSLLMTLAIAWYAVRRLPWRYSEWQTEHRLFVVAVLMMVANTAIASAYIKDEIIAVGAVLYAVAAYITTRAMLTSLSGSRTVLAIGLAIYFAVAGPLWAFRAAGVQYQLRNAAFTTRNDWTSVLPPDRKDDWPEDAPGLSLTQALKQQALEQRVTSTYFLPRWGDRWWVE